jgi:hypothetical protein
MHEDRGKTVWRKMNKIENMLIFCDYFYSDFCQKTIFKGNKKT